MYLVCWGIIKKPAGAERTIRRMVGNGVKTAAGPENTDFYRMVCIWAFTSEWNGNYYGISRGVSWYDILEGIILLLF